MPILPDDPNGPNHYGFDEFLSATNYIEMDPLMTHNGEIVYLEGESSVLMVEAGLKFIEAHKDQPTFTVLWYGSPHFPYSALDQDLEGLPEDLDRKERSLLGEIVAMDRSIGMLRDRLRELRLAKNTLIWFCSDNGGREHDPHSQAGLRGYKGGLYEGGIRVPGLIEWPEQIKPQATDFPASTMDIMPTLIDLLALPEDSMLEVVDGESIVPLFSGETPQRTRPIYFGNKGVAVIDDHYKLVKNGNGKGIRWELYDLDMDPGETADLAAQFPERVEQMAQEAMEITASIDASEMGKDYPEGKVIQPQRGKPWFEMEEYEQHYETFMKLKPGWNPPGKDKKPKRKVRSQ